VQRGPRGLRLRGYAVLERFLGPAALAVLRAEADAAVRRPPVAGCERPHNRLVPLRWSDRAVDTVLADGGRRAAIAGALGARDLRWISGYISVKEARTGALWWHQDWWCWDHPVSLRPAAAQVALLCYLGDTSERSGALRVLPGSHHRSVGLHAVLPEAHAAAAAAAAEGEALPSGHAALSDQPGQVTLGVKAGDAVVLDYRLLHGTHANASGERRDCVLLSFTPDWRGLPADVRAHLVQHLAQPAAGERAVSSWAAELLPRFDGARADLPLNRAAPARFAVSSEAAR
jgi:ectoine hydroxylase-related dioxygenase (phytanoyl-CoA dioxygenase family)